MMKVKTLLVTFALSVGAAQAQDTLPKQDILQLTLNKAIDIALSDNPTIKIADKEIERVDYSKKTAWGALLPTLDATGQVGRYVQRQEMNLGGMLIPMPIDNTMSVTVSLSLPLVVPALWQSIQMSHLDMQLAVEKARSSKITLKNDVTKAYYNVLLAQDSYMTLQESFDIAKQNYDLAKQRYEIGMAAEYDYVSAEVQLNNLLPNLLQVENAVAQSKMYLKVLLGLPMITEISIATSLSNFEDAATELTNKNGISLQNNSDLIQLGVQQQQLHKALQMQNAQHLPSLVAFGQYSYSGSGADKEEQSAFGAMAGGEPTPAGMQWTPGGTLLGLTLKVPIFSGMSNVYKAKQLKIQQQELELQHEYMLNSLSVQARTALDNMDKAAKQVESNKKGTELAKKGYQISQTRYTSGAGTMLELNSSALSLTQAKLSYNQSIVDYLSARADFEKIVGQNP